ncbi:protein diaphanous homolog 2-like isoform X5 [Amphibalanus amphitrite]|uniref:protein diaphanous homolog 2-like isoform X5 n=2 Tax=Amphibalanus amphitrite TaxID=1232801 RepID=UPI001C904DEF|nr:protein diaphanous homolog 2-like isoform X5 [Amphibalanus amphitrite]
MTVTDVGATKGTEDGTGYEPVPDETKGPTRTCLCALLTVSLLVMLALGVALGVLLLTSVYAKPQQRAIPLRMPDSVRFDNITVEREGQARVRAFQETSRAGQGMRSVVRVGPDGPPRTTMETIAGRPALPMPTVFGPPPTRPGPPVEPGLPPMTTAPAPFPTEQRLPLPTMADLPPLPTAPGLVRFVPLPAFSAGGPPEHREFFASIQRNIDETERRIREWQANF